MKDETLAKKKLDMYKKYLGMKKKNMMGLSMEELLEFGRVKRWLQKYNIIPK